MSDFPPWRWSIPERFNIGVACTDAHAGTSRGTRTATVVDDAGRGVRQATFAELARDTSRVAQLLRELGVAAGERVLIRLPNCLEYPLVFLGTMKRGAIAVPTSPLLTAEEVVFLVRDCGATVMVTDAAGWDALRDALDAVPHVRHVLLIGAHAAGTGRIAVHDVLVGANAARTGRVTVHDLGEALARVTAMAPPEDTRAEDPAYLVYTSGTTGYPKGVLHAHRALLGRQPSSTYWFDFLPDGERVLHSGKYNWTYVLGTGMMDPLYRGHTTIVAEGPGDAARWPRLIAAHGATTFIGVPSLYRQILEKTATGRADVPSLRHCMSAGELLSDEVLAGWRARFGLDIYEGLGMTECSYYLCETRSRPIRPGSAGFAQPGHDVHLLDPDTMTDVAPGAEGMLCIPRSDPALLLRYWNQPEETAHCFKGDWFLTGDYARRDDDGYIWFLGRKDDLLKSFGYRVSPHEVARVLRDHPAVADATVVGEDVARGKTLIVAYVILRPGSPCTPEDILSYGRHRLASYKAPRIVYVVDDFPRTPTGKVLRRALTPARARLRAE